ncbi:MAG: hypothetical protein ACO3O7_05680 [Ilumatobacteraceae bacterium]
MSFPPSLLSAALSEPIKRFAALDPMEQIIVATRMNEVLLEGQASVAGIRRSAIRSLRASGYTLAEIAKRTGMTPQRVHQLEIGQDRRDKR